MGSMEELLKDLREVCEKYETEVKFGQSPIEVEWVNYRHRISDDTHDKVYELNKQMCDLEIDRERWDKIGKEWESKKKEIVLSILKGNNMEKKKMTKAEAFEYLKGKKVKCYKVGEHYGEELLKKLTECGCTSNIFLPKGILSVWAIFISDVCDLSILDTAHADQYGNYDLCEISADDILSIEIVEGTSKFSYEKVVELAKPLMEFLNDTGCSERICVTYESIVAEPMAKFIHGQMKGC